MMSATALRWLNRQRVDDGTLLRVLRVLADKADAAGACREPQEEIAAASGANVRTVQRAITLLEQARALSRARRSSGKNGRLPDLIQLDLTHKIDLSREAIADARSLGATRQTMQVAPVGATRHDERVQHDKSGGCNPTESVVAPTASRAEHRIYTSPETSQTRVSGRIWFDRQRQAWRAAVRLDGVDITLGRHRTEAEAARVLEGALADIEHSASHPSGTPRNPAPMARDPGSDLGSWLFGDDVDVASGGRSSGRPAAGSALPQPSEFIPSSQSPTAEHDITARPDGTGRPASEEGDAGQQSYAAASRGW